MKLYATASRAESDLGILRAVRSYASMGFITTGVEIESVQEAAGGFPHILISFAYDAEGNFFEEKLGYEAPDWMLDSGAFSMWTVGKAVDLEALIAWARQYAVQKPEVVTISLDVIPGEAGGNRAPTKKQKLEAVVESMSNGDAMRSAGLKIMEVFHVFEPMEQFERLLERRQPGEIIGLGGMVGRSTSLKRAFADACFARAKEQAGGWQGIVPLHALGLSVRSPLAARYPWWSMDSSTWIAAAQYGQQVGRGGGVTGDDKRTGNRSVRHLYLVRTLEGWLVKEQGLTDLWAGRGVTFAADMDPVAA